MEIYVLFVITRTVAPLAQKRVIDNWSCVHQCPAQRPSGSTAHDLSPAESVCYHVSEMESEHAWRILPVFCTEKH